MWPNRYQVMLDDRVEQVFVPAQGVSWSATLPFGEHRLKVFKQAEALVGDSQVTSVRIDGEWLETPRPTLRIEFVGDSLSTGYGNEGPNRDCHFSEATQNQWLAYPSLVARALNAEHTVIAWSGKGVIRNYEDPRGGTPPEVTERDRLTVPQLYARTHPERQPAPDIVVVALGANDFSARDPGEEAFVAGYWALLQSIKTTYPKARMLAVVPPIEDGWPPGQPSLTLARKYIRAALLADTVLVDLPRADPTDGLGCDWHPSLARHKKIAEAVVRALAPGER
jgi:lysophospholipase L1-like esterase